MASLKNVAAASAVISLLLCCPMKAQGQDSTEQVKQEIFDRETAMLELYRNEKFSELCNEVYTEDCVIYFPGNRVARGREECAREFEALKDDYQFDNFNAPIIKEVIVTSSDYVIEHSVNTDTEGLYVKYIDIWKRIDGKLYIFHDIANANTPYKEPTLLEEVTDRRSELSYYFNTGDFKSVCNGYTPDCWFAPPGAPPVSGRDECERLMVKVAISGIVRISEVPEQYEVINLGDGYILNHGACILYDEADAEVDRGKDMVIWKKMEDGQLYIQYDMWNSDIHF